MTYGIVDIGSNTIRMNIYKIYEKDFKLLLSKKESVGLVSYIKKKKLTRLGMEVLKDCLDTLKEISVLMHLDGFSAFATASLRNIKNTDEVLNYIQEQCQIKIHCLSSTEEGRLSFIGARNYLKFEEGIYIDTGGGSTEIILFDHKKADFITSIPLGSLNLYQDSVEQLIPTKKEIRSIVKKINHALDDEDQKQKLRCENIVITGGSMRAIRKLLVFTNKIDKEDYTITPDILHQLVDDLSNMSSQEVIRLFLKVKADRVHTLFTGLLIVDTFARYMKVKKIQVSIYGVREGYLMKRIIQNDNIYARS